MSYSLTTPQAADYAAKCRAIAADLSEGLPVFVQFENHGSRFQIVLVRLSDCVLYGEPRGTEDTGEWVVVSVIGRGAHWLSLSGFVHPIRVGHVLRVDADAAVVIAEFLVRVGSELQPKGDH